MLATAATTATAATSTKVTMLANIGTTKASTSMLMTTTKTTSDAMTKTTTVAKIAPHSDTTATATMPSITTATAMPTTTTPVTRTITSDPGILCFHHCNVKVFCFHLPHRCPKCKQVLDTGDDVGGNGDVGDDDEDEGEDDGDDGDDDADDDNDAGGGGGGGNEMGSNGYNCTAGAGRPLGGGIVGSTRLLPFRLPYPFIRASQYPCAIVLRPTTGDFLNDYNNSTDLHIAVTTSTGCVVEFDRHGLRRHRADNTRMTEWWQCLLVGDVPEPWYDYWDEILQQICNQPDRWTVAHYQEDSHNCYTFVLAFLQALAYDKLSAAARSKTSFCEKYIVPRTTTAGKYISLYRKLRDTGIYVHPHHQHHQRHHAVLMKQQQKQQQQIQHYHSLQQQSKHQQQPHQAQQQQQQLKSARGKLRLNGHITGSSTSSLLLANGGKATSIILRAPNLCTIEE
ncbi:uncharacterized protein LOC118741174 [Rhagoletis pomonella]|uniref:uncharacterized protein LOC118741174 n=1 Tax=Rhagoletis pomonella TaxID=28610 RepID=UPI00177E94A3|nr:uncharacterized protein LOC118741174 [Rhagoletis pomonella]